MADTVYTRLLARATEIEGSTQGLAHKLRVPEATLLRWLSGRAQMPFKAYEVLLQFVQDADSRTAPSLTNPVPATTSAGTNPERLTFPLGQHLGRCARCDGTEFRRYEANAPLKMTSVLECCSCFAQVIHGALLVELGKDVMANVRASAASRTRRLAAATTRSGVTPTARKASVGR